MNWRRLPCFILATAASGCMLFVPGCGTKTDSNQVAPTSRYTCDGTLATCLLIKAGWTLSVKTTDEIITDPSVVALPDGSFRIYGNDGNQQPTRVISLISTDGGITFTREAGYRVVEDANHDAFFPDVVALPNGQFRMYLTDQRTYVGTIGAPAFISAISDDGLNFTWEPGERLVYSGTGDEITGIRNENVVLLSNGTYRMYYVANARVLSAVSPDGLTFTREPGIRHDPTTLCPAATVWENPKLYLDATGVAHMFTAGSACTDVNHSNEVLGIFEGTSPDGLTFTFSSVAVIQDYYIRSLYHGNPTDPVELAEDPMLTLTPAGLRMYFSAGNSAASPPDARYYSVYNPTIR
jgi:hypothetical protein